MIINFIDDKGSYLCIASNGVLPSVSKRFVVTVNCMNLSSLIVKLTNQINRFTNY